MSSHTLSKTLNALASAERVVCFLAFSVLACVVFLDVMLRELLGNGLPWARQVGVYANIIVAMIGIGVASDSGSHLRPRFADKWLPASWEPVIVRLQDACMALFCLFFVALATHLVVESYRLGEISTVVRSPIWVVQSLIPLAFAIAALRHCLYAFDSSLRPDVEPKKPGEDSC